jgi:PTH1 family peptidyl-tRNA hydrolase
MKFLIVCLGNPGPEYHETRHNIGFMVADRLAAREGKTFETTRLGWKTEIAHRGRTLILLKPSTFMNLSGKAFLFHQADQKIPVERTLVVTDDLALPFGKLRLKGKGSHGGHNGLRNISELLGNDNYPRLRIGIGNNFNPGKQVDYVLNPFSKQEQPFLPEVCDLAIQSIEMMAFQGIDHAMTWLNGRKIDMG